MWCGASGGCGVRASSLKTHAKVLSLGPFVSSSWCKLPFVWVLYSMQQSALQGMCLEGFSFSLSVTLKESGSEKERGLAYLRVETAMTRVTIMHTSTLHG